MVRYLEVPFKSDEDFLHAVKELRSQMGEYKDENGMLNSVRNVKELRGKHGDMPGVWVLMGEHFNLHIDKDALTLWIYSKPWIM